MHLRRRHLMAIGLSLLLILAGCAALPGGSNTTTPATPSDGDNTISNTTTTSTDTTHNENATSEGEDTYPPGVNQTGFTNKSSLVNAHFGRMNQQDSYTITVSQTVEISQNESETKTQKLRWENGTAAGISKVDGDIENRYWSNGNRTVMVNNVFLENGSKVSQPLERPGTFDVEQFTGKRAFLAVIEGFAWETAGITTVDGKEVVKLTTTGFQDRQMIKKLYRASKIQSANATLFVTPNGHITDMHVELDMLDSDGNPVAVTSSYKTTVGSTTVGKPTWVTKAEEQAPDLNAELSGNNTYLKITHQGGETINGALLQVQVGQERSRTVTNMTISKGDTVYAFVQDGQFRLTNEPPEDAQTLTQGMKVQFFNKYRLPVAEVLDEPDGHDTDN